MTIIQISEEEILSIGLKTFGCESWKTTNAVARMEGFKSCFSTTPKTCKDIFVEIQAEDLGAKQIRKPNLIYFLITMHWLYKYKTEKQMSIDFKICEKTIRKYIWIYAEAIEALKTKKVSNCQRTELFFKDHVSYSDSVPFRSFGSGTIHQRLYLKICMTGFLLQA